MKRYILLYATLFMIAFAFASVGNALETNMKVFRDTDDGVAFEVALPFFEFISIEDSQFSKVNVDGFGIIRKSGAPGVIIRGVLIEVPPECEVDVQAYSLDKIRFENFLLAPSPERILVEGEQGEKTIAEQFRIDEAVYSTDAFFPGKLAEVEFTGVLRDKRGASIKIFPVQYNPSKNILLLTFI